MNSSVLKSQSEVQSVLNSIKPEDPDKYIRWARLADNVTEPPRMYPGLDGKANSALFRRMYNTGRIGNTNVNTNNEMLGKKAKTIRNFRSNFKYPFSMLKRELIVKLNDYINLIETVFHEQFPGEKLFTAFKNTVTYIDEWIQIIDNIDDGNPESISIAIRKSTKQEIRENFRIMREYLKLLRRNLEHPDVMAGLNIIKMFEELHNALLELQSNTVGGRRRRRNRKTMRSFFKS